VMGTGNDHTGSPQRWDGSCTASLLCLVCPMIVPVTMCHAREERPADPTPLFEGWHYLVDQEFQAPVHGFRGQ
jgi:hypothetical protein